jgi:DNA-binding transcriptional ArsR family regulator
VIRLAERIQGLVVVVDHSRKNRPDGQPMSSADIHGPYVKWASAEHIVMIDTVVEKPVKRLEVFIEGKDVESDRFFLTISPRGSGDEKFAYAGSAADLTGARQAVGDGNREAVLRVLREKAPSALSTKEIVDQLKQTKNAIAKATVIRHIDVLLSEKKIERVGEGKDVRYIALDVLSQVPSEPHPGATQ